MLNPPQWSKPPRYGDRVYVKATGRGPDPYTKYLSETGRYLGRGLALCYVPMTGELFVEEAYDYSYDANPVPSDRELEAAYALMTHLETATNHPLRPVLLGRRGEKVTGPNV